MKKEPRKVDRSACCDNLYLHYVLDLWFERVVKPRLQGEAHLVRYIDDFVLCFQIGRMLFGSRTRCANAWRGST